jgi:DNA-directed RNA polymerase specialized sigma24 family protein
VRSPRKHRAGRCGGHRTSASRTLILATSADVRGLSPKVSAHRSAPCTRVALAAEASWVDDGLQRSESAGAFSIVITEPDQVERSFAMFVEVDGERLRRVMAARYGVDIGCDAADAALAWAWERWERVRAMDNPAGYLYRVAQTHARRALVLGQRIAFPPEARSPLIPGAQLPDEDLAAALAELPEHHRMAVLLVHAYAWTPAEVGELTGLRAVTVRSHVHRGLRQLRKLLAEGATR